MKILVVNKNQNNQKLDKVIWKFFPHLKQNTFYKALRKKDIRVNDKRISENLVVHTGDIIKVFISDELLDNIPTFSIIYEDDYILVVNKPCNLEVTGDNSLTTYLEKQQQEKGCSFISPCHRLDRNTTGLVLFAKSEETLNILLKKFKNREIEKHYLATVYGILPKKQNKLEAYLFKDSKKSLVYISDTFKKGYQKIVTSYNVIEEDKRNNTSTLDINLETGKTHQIRAHLAHIGFPIIGDGKYGNNEINKKFNKKIQMLISYSLKFNFTTDSGFLNYLNNKIIRI